MRILPVLLLGLAALSCSSSSSSDPAGANASVTQTVGPEGGNIAVGGATVTFPAGALAASTAITITASDDAPPAGYVALSKVFHCEPSGTSFAHDVTMQMPFVSDGKPVTMFWSSGSDPSFKDVGGASVTQGATTTMAASVKHFSSGFVGRKSE